MQKTEKKKNIHKTYCSFKAVSELRLIPVYFFFLSIFHICLPILLAEVPVETLLDNHRNKLFDKLPIELNQNVCVGCMYFCVYPLLDPEIGVNLSCIRHPDSKLIFIYILTDCLVSPKQVAESELFQNVLPDLTEHCVFNSFIIHPL